MHQPKARVGLSGSSLSSSPAKDKQASNGRRVPLQLSCPGGPAQKRPTASWEAATRTPERPDSAGSGQHQFQKHQFVEQNRDYPVFCVSLLFIVFLLGATNSRHAAGWRGCSLEPLSACPASSVLSPTRSYPAQHNDQRKTCFKSLEHKCTNHWQLATMDEPRPDIRPSHDRPTWSCASFTRS